MKPISLKQMSAAVPALDGKSIKFTFTTHANEKLEFVCPPEAVPEITARLMGAMEGAALHRTQKPKFLLAPIVTDAFEVGPTNDLKKAAVMFCPTQHSRIGFALSPGAARKLADGLMQAAAMIDPVDPRSLA